jgi:glucuronosyltransferase
VSVLGGLLLFLYNLIIKISSYRSYFAIPAMDSQLRTIFGPNVPPGHELEKQHVLMLVNSHPAVDYAESTTQNIIQVGGMQIKEPKPVPEEIEKFMLKGKKGAVMMTLGTNLRSDQMGEERIKMVVEAFKQVPDYNFLWKFETSEMLPNLPTNVKIVDWLPQNDILAHPKLKLFITHAGLLSTHETTWHGVPMVKLIVSLPFYF